MRILFLTHRLPYAPNRGDRIRAHHVIKALAPHAAIDLLSLVHDEDEAAHASDLDGVVASTTIVRVSRRRNLLKAAFALPGSTPLTHVLLNAPGVRPALQRLVRHAPPDLVWAYCSGMAQFLFSPELRTIPSVLDMVDVDSAKWAALAATLSGPRRWVFAREARVLRRFEGAAAAHARATLVVNERERDALLPIAPAARIITVPNGIDSGFFAPTAPPAPSAGVVFCGVMDYEPNVRGAVWLAREVWPHVRSQRPDARLIIVGSNPAHAVATLADDRGAITVTGGVDDVRPHLWQAAVAVAPLLVARGLQNKVLEGLAAGLPAVVTPQVEEGLPAAVRAGCRTAADPTAFAAHIVSLLSLTPDDRRRLALAAQVERLDWRSTLQPAIELVKELAAYAR